MDYAQLLHYLALGMIVLVLCTLPRAIYRRSPAQIHGELKSGSARIARWQVIVLSIGLALELWRIALR